MWVCKGGISTAALKRVCARRGKKASSGRGRLGVRTNVLLILEKCINTRTGTDGCRILCRQFHTSSFPRRAHSISRCNTFWQKMNYFREAILLLSITDDQGQITKYMVFPLHNGPLWCSVWWRGGNYFGKLQMTISSTRKTEHYLSLFKSVQVNCTA